MYIYLKIVFSVFRKCTRSATCWLFWDTLPCVVILQYDLNSSITFTLVIFSLLQTVSTYAILILFSTENMSYSSIGLYVMQLHCGQVCAI